MPDNSDNEVIISFKYGNVCNIFEMLFFIRIHIVFTHDVKVLISHKSLVTTIIFFIISGLWSLGLY